MTLDLNKNQLRFLMLCIIWGSTWIGTKAGIEVVPPLLFCRDPFHCGRRIAAAIWVGPGRGSDLQSWGQHPFRRRQYVDDHPVVTLRCFGACSISILALPPSSRCR